MVDGRPADGHRTVIDGARVISGAEKKKHSIEAAPFGRGLKVMGFLYASIGGTAVAVRKALRLTEEHELPPLRVEPAGRPASPSGGR